jgi:hypothetical protein
MLDLTVGSAHVIMSYARLPLSYDIENKKSILNLQTRKNFPEMF